MSRACVTYRILLQYHALCGLALCCDWHILLLSANLMPLRVAVTQKLKESFFFYIENLKAKKL
jgi:hypothetical protein